MIGFEFNRELPLVRVMHTSFMSENPNEVMARGIELVSRLAGTEKMTCALGAEKSLEVALAGRESAYPLQYDAGELHYPHLNQAEPRCEVVHDIGWRKQVAVGGMAQGWMRAAANRQTVTFALPFLRESWPKGLGAKANGELRAGLWPEEYGPWDMHRVEIRYPVPGYFLEYLTDKAEARHWRGYMAGATMLRVSAMGMARTHDVFCWVNGASAHVRRDRHERNIHAGARVPRGRF